MACDLHKEGFAIWPDTVTTILKFMMFFSPGGWGGGGHIFILHRTLKIVDGPAAQTHTQSHNGTAEEWSKNRC